MYDFVVDALLAFYTLIINWNALPILIETINFLETY